MKRIFLIVGIVCVCFVTGYTQPSDVPVPKGTVRNFASGINNQAIAIDPSGNLWIASSPSLLRIENVPEPESLLDRLLKVHHSTRQWIHAAGPQAITEVSPSGTVLRTIALAAVNGAPDYWGPFSITIDTAGNVWAPLVQYTTQHECDTFNNCYYAAEVRVIKISPTGAILGNFLVGNSYSDEWIPRIVADSSGSIFVCHSSDKLGAGIVSKMDASGTIQGIVKISNRVYGITVDKASNLWGSNTVSDNISGVNPQGGILGPINTHHASTGLAIDPSGNFWVGGNAHEIEKISPAGEILSVTQIENNTGDGPRVIRIDSAGNVWAVNQSQKPDQGSAVVELNSSGAIIATFPMPNATDLAIDKQGNVWVTNNVQFGNNLYEIIGVASGPQYAP